MLNVEKSWNNFFRHTSKSSDVARQLGFAGIAIIWIFTNKDSSQIIIDKDLLVAGLIILFGLSLDALQYLYLSIAWHVFTSSKENSLQVEGKDSSNINDETFLAPQNINFFGHLCFYGKNSAILISYIFLLKFFIEKLSI